MPSHEERLRLYNEGLCDREIGDVVGLTGSAIRSWRIKNNLPSQRSKQIREKDQKRIQLHSEGYGTVEMAEILGVRQSTISHWKMRRGLAQQARIGAVERDKIIELSKKGKSSVEIASELGVSRAAIAYWKRKLDLPCRRPGRERTEKEVETIEKMHGEGYLDAAIAETLKRSASFVHKIRTERGLKSNYKPGEGIKVYWEEKRGAFNRKVINLYHKHPEWDWRDLVHAVDLYVNPRNMTRIKIIIGEHLTRVCRSQESCAFKPLLPENVLTDAGE